jgi:GNAT superfamily N-acetyltransferase
VLFTLKNGAAVRIRPIEPADKDILAVAHGRLSEETVYLRFLSAKPRLSGSELRYLTEVDGESHFALIAVMADRPDDAVGVARFVRSSEDPQAAEAAVVVGDAFQHQGLGRQLGLILADAARERGIRRFTATMLGTNLAAHRLMAAISHRLSNERPDGATRTLVAELAA